MPRGRTNNDRGNIFRKNEIGMPGPVKDKNKLMLRVLFANPSKGFISEPAYAVQSVF